jgi:hypothetical protein
MNIPRKIVSSAVAAAALSFGPPATAAQSGTDWLWLTASLVDCTWTVTVTWAGYKDAKYLEVFTTETYTGVPLVPTVVRIRNKDSTATVTLPPLAPSATSALFYPWAQLLDEKGNAIPSSLDFSGQNLGFCTAP